MSCRFPFVGDCVLKMYTVPVPPPPPPAPLVIELEPPKSKRVIDINSPNFNYTDICQWAAGEPQLWEVCAKYNICLDKAPFKYYYKHVDAILQVGPTCGLVALSMLLNGEVSPEEILDIAKMEGYSNNGEMFSCKDMMQLTMKVMSLAESDSICYQWEMGGLFSHISINKLLNGSMMLVPYDADFNHEPCLKQGHKAHWALVCGVIVVDDPGSSSYASDPNNVFVLCRHGKSRYLAAWRLSDLEKSNNNLLEFSPHREEDGLIYILPSGGIGGENGLRDQYIIFDRV